MNDLRRHNLPFMAALVRASTAVLESGWYILGPRVQDFELALSRYCGADHCIGVGNGTDALEISLKACGLVAGDQVITVANAGGYSTTAIRAIGAEPLYVDIEPLSMLMDLDELENAITPRTRAIIATHLYGQMLDMPRLVDISRKNSIRLIEDCAQAHGAQLLGRLAGTWGHIGCFSFYPTKNLGALGDGGAILTNDAALARVLRELRQYGWRDKYISAIAGGRNSRLDEIQAAMLTEKLPRLHNWNERRRSIARAYTEAFRESSVRTPGCMGPDYVAHLYVIRVGNRDAIRSELSNAGIGTDVHYPVPDHWQGPVNGEKWSGCRLEQTEKCVNEILTLPCFPEMTDAEVERVIVAVRQSTGRSGL